MSSKNASMAVSLEVMGVLSKQEQEDLDRHEKIIDGAKTKMDTAMKSLAEIHERKLYRSKNKTFGGYIKERFGFGRQWAYKILSAIQVKEELGNVAQSDTITARQASHLIKIGDITKRKSAYRKAKAKARGGKPSDKQVQEAVEEIQGNSSLENEVINPTPKPLSPARLKGKFTCAADCQTVLLAMCNAYPSFDSREKRRFDNLAHQVRQWTILPYPLDELEMKLEKAANL